MSAQADFLAQRVLGSLAIRERETTLGFYQGPRAPRKLGLREDLSSLGHLGKFSHSHGQSLWLSLIGHVVSSSECEQVAHRDASRNLLRCCCGIGNAECAGGLGRAYL